MFERFTERARQAIVLSQEEARILRHDYIGTEHLLLGVLREEEGLAAAVLDGAGVTIERAREEVMRIVGPGSERTAGQIPFTPRAKRTLELSLRAGVSLAHNRIGTEHLLLGLLDEGEGVAMRVLLDLGVDTAGLRAELLRRLEPGAAVKPFDPDAGRRIRLGQLDAFLVAAERREEVARVVGEAADTEEAAAALEKLLGLSRAQARTILHFPLDNWTRAVVEFYESERAALRHQLGDDAQ